MTAGVVTKRDPETSSGCMLKMSLTKNSSELQYYYIIWVTNIGGAMENQNNNLSFKNQDLYINTHE